MRWRNHAAMVVLAVFFLTGCATFGPGEIKKCSDTPEKSASTFLEGAAEFSITLLKAVTLPGVSLWAIFGAGDVHRGKELIKQLTTHPEVPEADRDCVCSLLAINDTPDPQEKIVVIRRETLIGDEERLREVGTKAYEKARNYSVERIAEQYLNDFQSLLSM